MPVGFVVLKAGAQDRRPAELQAELVAMVRDRIGAVAAFKEALVVARLPKTRPFDMTSTLRCKPD